MSLFIFLISVGLYLSISKYICQLLCFSGSLVSFRPLSLLFALSFDKVMYFHVKVINDHINYSFFFAFSVALIYNDVNVLY